MTLLYPTITPVSHLQHQGRSNWYMESAKGQGQIFRVPVNAKGYDVGGAYLGRPDNTWCATDGGDTRVFVRAPDLQGALREVSRTYCRGPITLVHRRDLDLLTGFVGQLLRGTTDATGTSLYEQGLDIRALAPGVTEQCMAMCGAFLLEAAHLVDTCGAFNWEVAGRTLARAGQAPDEWMRRKELWPEQWGGESVVSLITRVSRLGAAWV